MQELLFESALLVKSAARTSWIGCLARAAHQHFELHFRSVAEPGVPMPRSKRHMGPLAMQATCSDPDDAPEHSSKRRKKYLREAKGVVFLLQVFLAMHETFWWDTYQVLHIAVDGGRAGGRDSEIGAIYSHKKGKAGWLPPMDGPLSFPSSKPVFWFCVLLSLLVLRSAYTTLS